MPSYFGETPDLTEEEVESREKVKKTATFILKCAAVTAAVFAILGDLNANNLFGSLFGGIFILSAGIAIVAAGYYFVNDL